MGIKKYEIITVGSDKRVRALRSWRVQDRYVNIGDVGGIVYDEKTLSQDGACWLFRGNFNFPGARIGGDSIVDVGETTLPTTGSPNVDILGASVVVGSKLSFTQDKTAADAVTLTAADFEQGAFGYMAGANWESWKVGSVNRLRTKNPIFAGGTGATLKLDAPGYTVQAFVLDRDGIGISATTPTNTGAGVTLTIRGGQYFVLSLTKDPVAAIVPADATEAQITFTGTYDTKLSIIDSRVEINPATSTGTAVVKPGGFYAITSGAKYPEAVIRNSKMSIIVPASANRSYVILGQIIGSTATLDGTSGNVTLAGIYSNIKNLIASGVLLSYEGVSTYNLIQATDCDSFAVSPTIFPGLAAARTANMPLIFQGCNVPNGRFYHHAQIANTYRDINFDLATKDLGKSTANTGVTLVSSEVNGMYRLYGGSGFGCLVENHESVKSAQAIPLAGSYGTTIYKDAYFKGLFDIAGTNVFGNTKKHDTQDVSGCKIVNTGETAVGMKGNIRVEGNATLTNCSIIGSGYFGGNAVMSGVSISGCAYMKDNASFIRTAESGSIRDLKMTENAYAVLGDFALNGRIHLSDNARFTPTAAGLSEGDLIMKDNAVVSGAVTIGGVLTMKDNAKVSAGALATYGDITLCGSYNQTAAKTWTGKRVIASQDAPLYDNNVKTQYDF
nr:MAG TPA: Putative transferase, nesg, ydcK, Structural Genomics.38A [Caudoviricetes sp.]